MYFLILVFWYSLHLGVIELVNSYSGISRKEGVWIWENLQQTPNQKIPWCQTSMPWSESGIAVSGLEFKHASTCASVKSNSSKARSTPPTTRLRCRLKLLTPVSHSPPKCGARSGVKYPFDSLLGTKTCNRILRL